LIIAAAAADCFRYAIFITPRAFSWLIQKLFSQPLSAELQIAAIIAIVHAAIFATLAD
jgi:hypothetical protein